MLDELRAAERAVQDRHVVGIDHVLEMLQPVAGAIAMPPLPIDSNRRPRRTRPAPSLEAS
jgi:hypothetical protein